MKANHPANKHLEEYAIKFPFRYIFVMSLAFLGLMTCFLKCYVPYLKNVCITGLRHIY